MRSSTQEPSLPAPTCLRLARPRSPQSGAATATQAAPAAAPGLRDTRAALLGRGWRPAKTRGSPSATAAPGPAAPHGPGPGPAYLQQRAGGGQAGRGPQRLPRAARSPAPAPGHLSGPEHGAALVAHTSPGGGACRGLPCGREQRGVVPAAASGSCGGPAPRSVLGPRAGLWRVSGPAAAGRVRAAPGAGSAAAEPSSPGQLLAARRGVSPVLARRPAAEAAAATRRLLQASLGLLPDEAEVRP